MQWEHQDVSDDHGVNRRRDLVHVAEGPEGREWIVSRHDDGTWLWMWWDKEADEPIAMGEGFGSDTDALAAAERYAATVLR